MNILFQAYACDPDQGGEFAVSWGWITRLNSMLKETDKLYVVSLTLEQRHLDEYNLKNVELLRVKGLEKIRFLKRNYYIEWQKLAYKTVINSGICFDIVHSYSLSDFRMIGKWYKLKDTHTILGPVGGGQKCPKGLIKYDDSTRMLRDLVNLFCKINPLYRLNVQKYSEKYVCNYETKKYIKNSEILIDCPLNDKWRNLPVIKRENDKVKLLFCGRLINKKGVMFLIDIIQRISEKIDFELDIVGDGPMKDKIQNRIDKLNLNERIKLCGKVSYEKMSDVYYSADIFVLPSLRESGGSVLIEAMAHSLPIVSLDMALSKILKEHNVGKFVDISGPKEDIIRDFSEKLTELILDKSQRKALGANGYEYANSSLTWDSIFKKVYGDYL